MGLQPINIFLIGAVAAAAVSVMAYWWCKTRGAWWDWPAGRSVMALLAIITAITTNAVVHSLIKFPPEVKTVTYSVLYIGMLSSISLIGGTIRAEMLRGQRNRRATDPPKEPCTKEQVHDH